MATLTEFTTLTFDCYGTLIDWERGILAELRPWAASRLLAATDDQLLEAFGEAEAECEAQTPERRYPDILADVMRRLAARWSVRLHESEAAAFGRSVGGWPAFPDSPDALRYLKNYFKLVVVSNVDHVSFAESQRKLGVSFDRVITAEDVGAFKPSLRNFEYALDDIRRTLGVERHQVLHTAQSLFHDIVPAKTIGLRTMWINRRRGSQGWGATPPPRVDVRADFEVDSLGAFAALHQQQIADGQR
jgi:2-haloacid dehalogenase